MLTLIAWYARGAEGRLRARTCHDQTCCIGCTGCRHFYDWDHRSIYNTLEA